MNAREILAGIKFWFAALFVGPVLYGVCKFGVWLVEMPMGKPVAPYVATVISVTVALIVLAVKQNVEPTWFMSEYGDKDTPKEG